MDEQDPALLARRLLRDTGLATLATALTDAASADLAWPYASLVLVACDEALSPLLFLSNLAVHTRNLMRDARASLLLDGGADLADPLTGARVTVLGRMEPVSDESLLDAYIRRHPSAQTYRGFRDFRLWRMSVERAHLVAGFGRIDWIEGEDLRP